MRILAYTIFAVMLLTGAAGAKVTVTVDKTTQRMTVAVDGATRWTWPVSTGRRGHATPSGTFQAFRMEEDHYSKEWDDAPMPHSIFFTKRGHAIHGSFETRRLGTAASAGCVRLHPDHARQLFALVKTRGVLNTTVVITGEEPRSAPAVASPRAAPPAQLNPAQARPAPPQLPQRNVRRLPSYDDVEYADPRTQRPLYRPPPSYRPPGYGPYGQPPGYYYDR